MRDSQACDFKKERLKFCCANCVLSSLLCRYPNSNTIYFTLLVIIIAKYTRLRLKKDGPTLGIRDNRGVYRTRGD